jgi:hypothetical protein
MSKIVRFVGGEIRSSSSECVSLMRRSRNAYVGFQKTDIMCCFDALKADDRCVGAIAQSAHLYALIGDSMARQKAAELVSRGHELIQSEGDDYATDWEHGWLLSVDSFLAGNGTKHVRVAAEHLRRYPADVAALLFAQMSALFCGRLDEHLALAECVHGDARGDLSGDSVALGALDAARGFALDQLGRVDEADAVVERALADGDRHHAWLDHAYAHAAHSRGDWRRCAEFLESARPRWWGVDGADTQDWIRVHNSWHAILCDLELSAAAGCSALERRDRALAAYDRHVFAEQDTHTHDDRNVLTDAVSLLWRLELLSLPVGNRWASLAEPVARQAAQFFLPFNDCHWIYALERNGQRQLADHLVERAADGSASSIADDEQRRAFVATARAIQSMARNRLDPPPEDQQLFEHLRALISSSFLPIGGSIPQRQLFANTFSL